jgi:CubicO group peptidase (beta-lactamase class C family)
MVKEHENSRFGIKLIWGLVIILISTTVAIWITGYTYIFKTLIYQYPDINDLEIFQSRIVAEKNGKEWPVSSEYNKLKLPANLSSVLASHQTVAFLIIKNDSIVQEEYNDNYNNNSQSNSFSMAKSIVGILTGIAASEGKFMLDDKAGKFLPFLSRPPSDQLTIRHLLMMGSGLNWNESYNSLFSKTTEAYYGTDLTRQMERLKVIRKPGEEYEYMSCNTVLLAMIISATTGKTISEYASEKLWIPLQAEHPAYWSLDQADGIEKSYCCFYSTARDFARIGKLYLDSGRYNGQQIVPSEYVSQSLTPNGLIDKQKQKVDYYGYHWWITERRGHRIFYARGILGQYIVVIPDERMIIVRLGNKRGEKIGNHYSDFQAYVDGALDMYGKKEL